MLEGKLAQTLVKAQTRGDIGEHTRKRNSGKSITDRTAHEHHDPINIEDSKRGPCEYWTWPSNEFKTEVLERPERQTGQESYDWWQDALKGEPLMRCLDSDDVDMRDTLFDKLLEEIQGAWYEAAPPNDMGELLKKRAFGDSIRAQLSGSDYGEEVEDDSFDNWSIIEESEQRGGVYECGLEKFMQRKENIRKSW